MNILSYPLGTRFAGKVINDWCEQQIRGHTSHYAEARKIYQHFIFRDTAIYQLIRMEYRTNGTKHYGFMKVKEN